MVSITFIETNGSQKTIDALVGDSLMQAALSNEVDGILADCGGALSCATCHIHIVPEWMPKVGQPDETEQAMLEMAIDPDETSRLSCQVIVDDSLDGLAVRLPKSQF